VSPESVKVILLQASAETKNRETVADYSPDYPKVIIHPLDTGRFQLIMSETRTFNLQAQSRTARDLIALTVRCFHAKKYLPTSGILQELFPVHAMGAPATPGTPMTGGSKLDECILLERITKELNKAMQQKDMSEKVLRNTHHEKRQLQSQLEETIRGFSEVITDTQDQLSGGSSSTSAVSKDKLNDQFRDCQAQNRLLEEELKAMRKQFDDARYAQKVASASGNVGGSENCTPEVMQMREKRDMLKMRLTELSSCSGQQRGQADQTHTQELKRMRNDVETLHDEKEALRGQLRDADRTRQELQENFLYVKNQLDKVQVKQAQTAAGNTPEEKDVKNLTQAIEALTEEKSRLNQRLEGVQRGLEKEKSYHESSLERLLNANGKLLEEKDRSAKEVQRLSQLYAESVRNVQQGVETVSGLVRDGSDAVPAVAATNQDELKELKMQVAQVDESLKKKEQENDSLKSRIRKLAVA